MRPIVVFALALSAGLAGCDLVKSPDDRDGSHHRYSYCDSTGCYTCDSSGCTNVNGNPGAQCRSDWDCSPGSDCENGACKKTSMCQTGTCPSGQTCDSRSTCVSGDSGAPTCTQDSDCANGFCDLRSKTCVVSNPCYGGTCSTGWTCDSRNICIPMPCSATQTCQTGCYCDSGNCIESAVCNSDQDCASLSMTCDTASHTCVPSQTTTPPPPPPGCTTDAGCAAGESCCNGECKVIQSVPPADSCTNQGQCGPGGECIYDARNVGLCHIACQDDTGCGTGDYCFGGICQKNPTPTPQCVFNTECPADNTCINATCHPDCTDTCPNPHDFCDQGICQPDWRRVSECSLDTDCSYALDQCVNGTCATRCMQDADCSGCPHGPTCIMGYCGQG